MAPRFSVALCTYNGAVYLGEQLASIAAQSRLPDELVVVDDASRDDTLAIVRAFAAGAPFPVRLLAQAANQGSAASFGRAIAACSGDLIALADQDDRWRADKLAVLEAALADPAVGMAFSNARLTDQQLVPLGSTLWGELGFTPGDQAEFARGGAFEFLLRRTVVAGTTAAFRASYRPLILPIPALQTWVWTHDGWIALLIAACAAIVPVDATLIDYRQHPAQQVGAFKPTVRSWAERRARIDYCRRVLYPQEREQYRWLRERLAAGAAGVSPAAQRALEAKLDFLSARVALAPQRLRRLGVVYRQLVRGNYNRFGAGLRSALIDLLV